MTKSHAQTLHTGGIPEKCFTHESADQTTIQYEICMISDDIVAIWRNFFMAI
jgi:hypothetical protein